VTSFVSHGSLGVDERRQTEAAFAEARDCVIVATSTLELGIDVGDLDHVIQIDSPATVASFLQRIGRTGRRPGTARNMTFLATSGDALVLTAALLHRWSQGFVEPTVPPPLPAHLLAQQVLALTLQESQIGSNLWPSWFGNPPALGVDVHLLASDIIDHLVTEGYLIDGGGGMLSIGVTAEAELGRRHFMDLLAVFSAPPLFSVVHGRVEVGSVPTEVLLIKQPDGGPKVLLLGGRSWEVVGVDWKRRVINVQPSDRRGVARWMGGGAALGGELALGVRDVLAGVDPQGVTISRRAEHQLAECRAERPWVRHDTTTLVTGDSPRWWTFAGQRANTWLAELLTPLRRSAGSIDGLSLALDPGTTLEQLNSVLSDADIGSISLAAWVSDEAAEQLKFAECLPPGIVRDVVTARLRDDARVAAALREPIATARA
jgi:ATP-dependent Lhr-like helicase